MTIEQLYRFAIEYGISQDPRGEEQVMAELKRNREEYRGLSAQKKKEYDAEKLTNPYSDSRILYSGNHGKKNIRSIMVGVDMETPELLLADRLREKGKEIDLVVAHHPEGQSYVNFHEVMNMQSEILSKYGVPINVAEGLMEKRMQVVKRRVMPNNHFRPTDAARLLDIPFMNIHTPADNCVATYLQKLMDAEQPRFVDDVVKLLKKIPEYSNALLQYKGPSIISGAEKNRSGRVFVDMTGGTEGSEEIFDKLSSSGVGTIVGMHMSEAHYENAKKYHINVVIAGHISSDTLGLNLLFNKVMKKFGTLTIIPCSGYYYLKH